MFHYAQLAHVFSFAQKVSTLTTCLQVTCKGFTCKHVCASSMTFPIRWCSLSQKFPVHVERPTVSCSSVPHVPSLAMQRSTCTVSCSSVPHVKCLGQARSWGRPFKMLGTGPLLGQALQFRFNIWIFPGYVEKAVACGRDAAAFHMYRPWPCGNGSCDNTDC